MTEPGAKPTLRDVAQKAGVHPGTASRALNPETASKVNAATAKRVMRAAKALGYRPNPIARSLRTSRSHTIGMLIPDFTNSMFPPMVRGVDRVLSERDYTLLLADTDNNAEREERLYGALRDRQVDGLVIGTALRHHPLLTRIIADEIPFVLVNRLTDDHPTLAVVGDEVSGIRQTVAHLVGLGHRRIAYLSGPLTTTTGAGRLSAYKHALAAHDIGVAPELITECAAWTEVEGAKGLRRLLDGNEAGAFTAVMAGNDMIALGCYGVFRERGIVCPDDLSLVGFNDMPFIDHFAPPLTTVRIPNGDIGVEAANLLLDAIGSGSVTPKVVTLPVRFIVRGSTGPA
ncbi:LacI family DNA-binding transcriptional regulator [Streptosporangium sp. NPDC051022]|uniref:LacI family DNA-binding transcriptional regulator n=1 Tax=Streptosporangium sp. NPDC051022 TaxID=3155752 RepID=UPI0034429517